MLYQIQAKDALRAARIEAAERSAELRSQPEPMQREPCYGIGESHHPDEKIRTCGGTVAAEDALFFLYPGNTGLQ